MSLNHFLRAAACALVLLMATPALAEVVSSKGMATVAYKGRLTPAVRQAAMHKANMTALESYVAETWMAKVKVFESRHEEFAAKLDRLLLGSTILSENVNKDARTYSVVVRAEINAPLLQAALDGGSAVATAAPGVRSSVAMLFLSRMQNSVQSFQAREYRRVDSDVKANVSGRYTERTEEGESIGSASIGTSGSISRSGSGHASATASLESGGSTTQKADKILWTVSTASEINTAMTGIFSGAGYDVVEAEYLEPQSGGQLSIARIRQDYSQGNDLSAAVMQSTVNGIQRVDIPYLAFGTIDVGIRDQDPVTGLVRVFVNVSGKVLDVSGRFPKTVSSVGPVQFSGLGNTETVARTNALKLAAEQAAQVMVDELNVRAIR